MHHQQLEHENSFITALDLSLRSLLRKIADELQINNIEFIQMDILYTKT